ncbi:hypothetical protein D9M68_998370 [compost metagenome]
MSNFAELKAQFDAIEADAKKFEAGNKSAGVRVRKGLLAIEKASKAYRAETLKS